MRSLSGNDHPRWQTEHNNVIRLYDQRGSAFPTIPPGTPPPPKVDKGRIAESALSPALDPLPDYYVDELNHYTTLHAATQKLKPNPAQALRLLFGFPLNFLKTWLLKRHVTGGLYGLQWTSATPTRAFCAAPRCPSVGTQDDDR